MKVLVTGFDPFGGEKINPSIEAVKRLNDKIAGADIVKVEIPTVFYKSIRRLEKALDEEKPDIAICVGQAGGRSRISIERVAINISDGRIPDNEGNQPIDEVIFEEGDTAYFAKLPIKAMVKEMNKRNIPAEISNTAGTYVCNHLMYGLLYNIHKKYPNMKGGFIHIPFIPEQVIDKKGSPSMSLDLIVKGLTIAIETAIKYDEDIKEIGGEIH
ncbi:pyroglutamyl-peptidase I [Tepidimicrobium xylanilyticum]|uniref:Pyrrolidone-carboxylate peptidase n=1 Tax=Tepidimicrobium xylanilyticum TaxID=1123352 RepID=A0A1H2PZZ0_9FIRM|nr:pyroglutamyl-peptidase I [Tepidimicrobium xylanilyticum]GMG95796.1 pyrrolidone-carboxylate peptidase [Tepidimicrobium xylanilyticum]SDW00411.1 pyroglutamyl-peptidase [Tepidimicrobium xylanilyticum]